MRPHYLLLLITSLSLFAEGSYARKQLQFARISYSPIQNVGEKVIKEVYRRADVGITVKELPARRAAYETSKGERDGEIMRIKAYREDESPLYRVPYAVGDVKTQVYVRESLSHIQVEDLRSYSVAVVRGVRHANIYVKDFAQVIRTDDVAKAMKLLSKGRVDAAVISQLNGEHEIKVQNLTNVVPLSEPVTVQGIYHYINKKHPHIIQKIESTLQTMHESGELEALWNSYVEEELNKPIAKKLD